MKDNIWIFNQYTGSPYHGMGYRWYYLSKQLVSRGYNVYIFSGTYSHQFFNYPSSDEDFNFEEIDGINYCWIKTVKYGDSKNKKRIISWFEFTAKLYKLKKYNLSKPDIIIASSLQLFPVFPAVYFKKKYKCPFVFEVRDIWPLSAVELGGYSPKHPFVLVMEMAEKYAYKKADAVVSVLPKAKEHMIKQGLDENKFNYIPNGIDINEAKSKFQLDQNVSKKLPDKGFVIGYAGTIGLANNMGLFIEAANLLKEYKDIYFVIAGKGSDFDVLRKKTTNNKLNNVIFTGFIPKREVYSLIQKFDVCYIGWRSHPIYRFGISATKLYDYLYSGKPIIHATNAGNDPVAEAKAGISIKPDNADALAKSILKLYNMNEEERTKLGQNGKEYVIKNNSYDELAEKYIKLFNKLKLGQSKKQTIEETF